MLRELTPEQRAMVAEYNAMLERVFLVGSSERRP
jgi:hypothetical protein